MVVGLEEMTKVPSGQRPAAEVGNRGFRTKGMRFTIFSRLVIGYLTLFLLVLAVSVYAIVRLRQMEAVTKSILATDNRLIDLHKKLTDSLLEQAGNEKKLIILKDPGLFERFMTAGNEFQQRIDEAQKMPVLDRHRDLLSRVHDAHDSYTDLVQEEAGFLFAGSIYAQKKYAEEKEKLVDRMVRNLSDLKVFTEQNISTKIQRLGTMGARTRRVATLISSAALLIGLFISILITRGITAPLVIMKAKASDIASGSLEGDLAIASPPEMGELAQTLNYMCGRLKELDKMKSDFFSVMSHELRTPLSSIREGTSLLLEGVAGEASEKQQRLLTIISDESNRLIDLVNSFLAMAKMEAGMMEYEFTPGNLNELIQKVMREMEPLGVSRKIALETSTPALPPIRMDSEKLLQVLRNLIGNALKFTPEGGSVRVEARQLGRQVRVEVSDTGPGLSRTEMAVVFDRYRQASAAGSNRLRGTGLGLSIVQNVIKAHGGRVWAESTPGEGSTFVFLLPVEKI